MNKATRNRCPGGFGDRARLHWAQPQLWRPRRHRIEFLFEQRVDPEVPIEDVAGPVRDFITGCWPTVRCATSWTELTAPQ
jgi:hypothetical protein